MRLNFLIRNCLQIFIFSCLPVFAVDFNSGKELFNINCLACHKNGQNVIIPEKNLKYETLEENGMNNIDSIMYQIINGKNGMPAFGGRLKDLEIEEIAQYVLKESIVTNKKEF